MTQHNRAPIHRVWGARTHRPVYRALWHRFLSAVERLFSGPHDRVMSPETAILYAPISKLDPLTALYAEDHIDRQCDTDPRLLARLYLGICDDVDAAMQYNEIRRLLERNPEKERLVRFFRVLSKYIASHG